MINLPDLRGDSQRTSEYNAITIRPRRLLVQVGLGQRGGRLGVAEMH